jgi:signal transduction histidine kinase
VRDIGQGAEIAVTDRGPGIPAGDRERIFERFYRSPGSLHGGLGLGLHISREIVRLHGGRISVARADGGGARFAVELPGGGA